MDAASSAVGWVISMGKDLQDGRQFEGNSLEIVSKKLPGVNSRLCTSYATLIYCLKKVCDLYSFSTYRYCNSTICCLASRRGCLINEAEEYLTEIAPLITKNCVGPADDDYKTTNNSPRISAVLLCVSSIVKWAMALKLEGKLYEVGV